MWNVCDFPSPGTWHHSTPSSKHQDQMAWFLWYNLSRILHDGSSDFPGGTKFRLWNPHWALLISWADGLQCILQQGQHLHCLSTALWASESMSSNEVNLITQFYGQPSCSLIRLDQNFNPSPPARDWQTCQSWPRKWRWSCPFSKCSYFISRLSKYTAASQTQPSFWDFSDHCGKS